MSKSVFSEEHKAAISRGKMGHVVTEETKRKISESNRIKKAYQAESRVAVEKLLTIAKNFNEHKLTLDDFLNQFYAVKLPTKGE